MLCGVEGVGFQQRDHRAAHALHVGREPLKFSTYLERAAPLNRARGLFQHLTHRLRFVHAVRSSYHIGKQLEVWLAFASAQDRPQFCGGPPDKALAALRRVERLPGAAPLYLHVALDGHARGLPHNRPV